MSALFGCRWHVGWSLAVAWIAAIAVVVLAPSSAFGWALAAPAQQDSTGISATCSPQEVTSGNPTTCTATVTDYGGYALPSGTVTFTAPPGSGSFGAGGGACTLAPSSAAAACSTTFTPSSTTYTSDELTVAYGGDSNHTGSQTETYVGVSPPTTTATELSCTPSSVPQGSTTTCTATVLDESGGSAPTGAIALSSVPSTPQLGNGGGCTLAATSGSAAACKITFTPPATGKYALTATYAGDSSHLASRGVFSLLVADPTTTALSCQPSTVPTGATTTCTALVTDTSTASPSAPTGEIIFSFPRKWSTSDVCTLAPSSTADASSCQLTLTPTSAGKYTVTASYLGDSAHLTSTGRASLTTQGSTSGSGPVSGPPGTQCADPYPSASNPANRLMLPVAPGSDPLHGASFFVNGPTHGFAAGAIARLLGIDSHTPIDSALTTVPETESWLAFAATIPVLEAKQGNNPTIDHEVAMLEKIASEPETQRVSSFSQGGGPGALYSQTQKLFCHNFLADPGAIPIISTYFLHPVLGGCASPAQIRNYGPTFRRRVNEVAEGTGSRPAVFLVEIDGIGSTSCMARRGDLKLWLADMRYEDLKLISLPHTLVYVEGGYSDSNSPAYTARALKQVAINKITGFWTNDTHINWTINEIRWGNKVSRLTGGAHFVINTAQNGNGPLLNKHPTTQGVEDLCNPPGRGLGPQPTTSTGFPRVDAFIWSSAPGISSGSCNGGTPSGTFWTAHAVSLAANANDRLGPGYPSRPY
jgi:Glycosyl hydrolases family 6